MKAFLLLLAAVVLIPSARALMPPITELDLTTGYSSEGIGAVAGQVRVFGETSNQIRYYVEAAWGTRKESESDAFGSAYPYDGKIHLMETYAEKEFPVGKLRSGIRLGRYRPPFGISGRSDHAYIGFLRSPLIRYGEEYTLANTWLDDGVDLFIGVPAFQIEGSVGSPQDPVYPRKHGTSKVLRAQGYVGDLILGASVIDTPAVRPDFAILGRTRFTGVDARWMKSGVQLRGEWITGRTFDGVKTRGWYVDAIVHPLSFGPVTAVARYEKIDYVAVSPFAFVHKRLTLGAKIRLTSSLTGQVNFIRNFGFDADEEAPSALDIALTYALRY